MQINVNGRENAQKQCTAYHNFNMVIELKGCTACYALQRKTRTKKVLVLWFAFGARARIEIAHLRVVLVPCLQLP